MEDLARHPEKREPPLRWGLRYIVWGNIWLEGGKVVLLDDVCREHGLDLLPYVEELPDELLVDWGEEE